MADTIGPVDLETLRSTTINQIELLIETAFLLVILLITPWPVKDFVARANNYIATITGLLSSIPGNVALIFTGNFESTHNLLYTLATSFLGPFGAAAAADYTALLQDIFTGYSANLVANKSIDPTQAPTVAAAALEEAAALGLGSRIVTLVFELFLPKQLNFMNWLGPQLAAFAGYDEIVKLIRAPELRAALGNLAEYNANQQFLTKAPEDRLARQMYARRLISTTQLNKLVGWAGTMAEFQAPTLATSYRAVQPRMYATLLQDLPFPTAQVQDSLQFAGLRDSDVTFLLSALETASTKNVRQQYLAAAVRSTELGTLTPTDLTSDMNSLGLSQDAQTWVQLTVATRKLEQLAELYRKSVSEAYKYGTVTDANYVASLEAIGIGAADAEAHYAIDSIPKQGKAVIAAERAAASLAAKRTRAATQSAIADYRSGTYNAIELEAALIAAGLDPLIATYATSTQVSRQTGPEVYVYGLELPRAAAVLLRERVGAIGVQVKAQLITPDAALAQLADLNIPDANAKALVAEWAATKTPAADVGVLLPP